MGAQVLELEHVGGWRKKKLKQQISYLGRELRGRDEVLAKDVGWIRELQERLRAWEEYAESLEIRNAMLENWVRGTGVGQ